MTCWLNPHQHQHQVHQANYGLRLVFLISFSMDLSFCDDFKNIKLIWPCSQYYLVLSKKFVLAIKYCNSMDSSFCDDFKKIKFIWPMVSKKKLQGESNEKNLKYTIN
ncbi:hypothetical protein BpHYR1_022695 [Brachionus plicatilis]|uniref:Uncharacterized protein n=1 Tax=Brachionus plicatilis TaxID=10195 RepID=A0A3M7RDF6_BRAPC|nr:hypothetical protein BpHYR1_022695 [Brachionus plicatilis]